jgi:hypothetical protein
MDGYLLYMIHDWEHDSPRDECAFCQPPDYAKVTRVSAGLPDNPFEAFNG